jgi:peptidoglycan/xylan/chitin deacetylase (PgdA/CDA1 family)
MSDLKLKGVFSITVNWLEKEDGLFQRDLRRIKQLGHMVCNHSMNHPRPEKLSIEQIMNDYLQAKVWLNARGFFGDYLILPFGGNSLLGPVHQNLLEMEFKWVRSVRGDMNESGYLHIDHAPKTIVFRKNLQIMPVTAIGADKYVTQLPESIAASIKSCGISVVMYHRVLLSTPTDWDCTWQTFKSQMVFLSRKVANREIDNVLPNELMG